MTSIYLSMPWLSGSAIGFMKAEEFCSPISLFCFFQSEGSVHNGSAEMAT